MYAIVKMGPIHQSKQSSTTPEDYSNKHHISATRKVAEFIWNPIIVMTIRGLQIVSTSFGAPCTSVENILPLARTDHLHIVRRQKYSTKHNYHVFTISKMNIYVSETSIPTGRRSRTVRRCTAARTQHRHAWY